MELKLKEAVIGVGVDDYGWGVAGRWLVWELEVALCFRMGGDDQPGGYSYVVLYFLFEMKTIVRRRRIVYGGF